MNKKRRFLMLLTVLALCVALVFSAFACKDKKDDNDPSDNDDSSDMLFANGDFETTSGENYPLDPGSWTGAAGSTSASSDIGTPSGTDNLIAGVINVGNDFKKNRKDYGNIDNPGKKGDDDNVLMIWNKVATSYKYTSAQVSVEKNKYYRLSLWVKTVGTEDDYGFAATDAYASPGAYVSVTGDAYARFDRIDTLGQWQKFETVIRSSELSDGKITVTLSLGTGDKNKGQMTQGYAFFDNVVLEDLNSGDSVYLLSDFETAQNNRGASNATYDMTLPDSDFDYATTTTNPPYTASKYTGVRGYGSGDNATTSGVKKGIIDADVTDKIDDIDVTLAPADQGTYGTRMLYLNNTKPTAYGYRASVAMRLAAGKDNYYAISLSVRTVLASGSVTLKLTNGSNTDERNIKIANVDTDGEWTTYTFYVQSNEKRTNSLYLELWLGEGGLNDTETHAQGAAFFDNLKMKKIDQAAYDQAEGDAKFSLISTKPATPIALDTFGATNYDENLPVERSNFGLVDTANWTEELTKKYGENPSFAVNDSKVLALNNFLPSAFSFSNILKSTTDDEKLADDLSTIKVNPNSYYMISLWVKTRDIAEGMGVNIGLVQVDLEKKYDSAVTTLSTFSNLNSDKDSLKDLANDNGYTEIQFYVQGSEYDVSDLGLVITLGSGLKSQAVSHVQGTVFIADISIESITASDYKSASSGDNVQKKSLVSSAGTGEVSSNGNFKYIDVAATDELYDNANNQNGVWGNDGKLATQLGVPTGWTTTNKGALTDETDSAAGVLDLKSDALISNMKSKFNALNDLTTFTNGLPEALATNLKTVLAIHAQDNKSIGYTSTSVSLSADSYYMFSVWAKAEVGSQITVELSTNGTTPGADNQSNVITATDDKWHQYFFFVQTGISSVSVKMGLHVGNPSAGDTTASGTAYFSNATYTTVTEEIYNNAVEDQKPAESAYVSFLRSWTVDGFDVTNPSDDSLSKPQNWTGSLVDTEASSDEDIMVGGVFDKFNTNWEVLGLDPDKNTDDAAIADAIFSDPTNNSVLAIYNKSNTAYQYSSSSIDLKADKYYRISVRIMTKKLPENATATVRLKINNQTYTFGRVKGGTFNEDTDGKRLVNGEEWTTYSFYIHTGKNTTGTATLSVGLGNEKEENWLSGYVFVDDYSVDAKLTAEDFEAIGTVTKDEDGNVTEVSVKEELLPTTYMINFTEDDATAESNKNEPTEEDDETETNNLTWLWITSGVIGAFIVVAIIVYLIKKYAPKRKRSLTKKSGGTPKNKRDQFKQ